MIKDMRKKEFYEKPSAIRKREKAQARKRHLKELEKSKDIVQKALTFDSMYTILVIVQCQ